jgi:hypothetical protein
MSSSALAPIPPVYSYAVHPSRVPTAASSVEGADEEREQTASMALGAPTKSLYSLTSQVTSPRAYATPTLPPGVLFIEEPSGIKIYVGSEQVQSGAPKIPR